MKKKYYIFASVLGILLVALGIGIIFGVKANSSFKVAFYQVEENYANPLKEKISEIYGKKIKFYSLEEKDFVPKQIAKKYDLLVSWKGDGFDELENYAKPLPSTATSPLVQTLVSDKALPLLLDHWEIAYLKQVREKSALKTPQDLNSFLGYLFALEQQVFVPFYASGSDDNTLLALVGAQVESFCGYDAYEKLIDIIKNGSSFEEILSAQVGKVEGKAVSLEFVLAGLCNYVTNGLTVKNWMNGTQSDVTTFTEDYQLGVLFTSLSNHRKENFRLMDRYEVQRVPVMNILDEHALIAPPLCVLNFSSSSDADQVLISLVNEDTQAFLSDETKLAPVNARAMAYDIQADDVRYLAAVSPRGAVPDLGRACFMNSSAKKAEFAKKIREYLEKNY